MKNATSKDLLTLLQQQNGGCSLYALHHILGVSEQAIYKIADGRSHMDSDTILIACDRLGFDPRPWILRVDIERCKSPKRRQMLERILSELDTPTGRAIAGLVLLVVGVDYGGF